MLFRIIGRLTVRFFKWLGRILIGTGRTTTHHPISSLISAVFIIGLVYWSISTNTFGLFGGSTSNDVNIEVPAADPTTGQAGPAPSDASRAFITGLYHQDGQQIWNSLSDRYKSSLSAQNIDQAAIQNLIDNQINTLKQQGGDFRYLKTQMQGQQDLNADASLEVYTNFYRIGDNLGNAEVDIVLDKNHKVDVVQTPSSQPEPLVSAIFVNGKAQASKNSQATAGAATTPNSQEGQPNNSAAQAANDFMAAVTNFDATKLWNTLSTDYQKQLQNNKITRDTIQKSFDDYRQQYQKQNQTISYQGYALTENVNFPGSRALAKYEAVSTHKGILDDFGYYIFSDASGKITNINADDPMVAKAFGIQQSLNGN